MEVSLLFFITSEHAKAMKRNSTDGFERRELPDGARQRKRNSELALEQLPEIRRE